MRGSFELTMIAAAIALSSPASATALRLAQAEAAPSGNMTVVGALTGEGVACQAMRGDDGRLYTFRRDHGSKLSDGDRVRVEGKVAEMSICQQGVTLEVTAIGPAP